MSDPWADDELRGSARERRNEPWVARVVIGAGLLGFVGVVAWSAYALMSDTKSTRKQVVQISLLKPPAPPPPPPQQKPPEPEVKEEVKLPEPEQTPRAEDAPPPSDQTAVDATGSGPGDDFNVVGKKGGTDITTLGASGGGGRDVQAWFGGLVKSHLQAQFSKDEKLRRADYRVLLRIWFLSDGRIDRFELAGSTGDNQIDHDLKLAMDHMPPLKQPPPPGIDQPVKLRVVSRGSG
jgi:periplasmic protein TonB